MGTIDGATSTTIVQFANMDQALAAGDLEAVMVMLGIERANTAEQVVKTKIETIRANNRKIQELNEILKKIQGKDDKEGTKLGLTLEEADKLRSYGIKFDDYVDSPDLMTAAEAGKKYGNSYGLIRPTVTMTADEAAKFKKQYPHAWVNVKIVSADDFKVDDDGKLSLLREAISNQVKQMSSNDQLDMVELQSAVSKQNNAVEQVSTIVKKFGDLRDSIVRKF